MIWKDLVQVHREKCMVPGGVVYKKNIHGMNNTKLW